MRQMLLRGLNRPAALVALLAAMFSATVLLAAPASADPAGSASWQLQESPGIETAADSNGVAYPYVTLPTGGRWYLECPLEPKSSSGTVSGLAPSIPLDRDHDRCGNDVGANAATYPGATWTSSTFADVNVDPNDPRCGQLVAHRADANPPDAVGPVFCTSRVLVYPTMNQTVAATLASWWPSQVLDSCPPQQELPVNPHSGLLCEGWPKGEWKNSDPPVPLQWWHKSDDGVDCAHIPAGHIPPSIQAWANGDPGALAQACQVMNNFFTGASLRFTPSVDLLAAVRAALAASGPDKQPKWAWGVCCGQTKAYSSVDWQSVVATVTGCLAGGAGGAALGGPAGAVIGCAAGGYAANAANSWLERHDCALTNLHCIVNAVSRWAANGFIDEMKFGLHQLTHGLAPQALFGQDAFIRMWEALALVSALLVALYALAAFGIAAGTLRPSIAMTSVRNILVWGWALVAAIPVTRLLLDAADGVTTFICSWAGARSWPALSDRFQASITGALSGSLPTNDDATVSLLLVLMVVVGAFAALWLAVWAFIRAAAIALSVLGIPLSAAALAGPPRWRRAPQLALSTLVGLILFKPLVAVVLVLGIGLMSTASSLGAFLIGIVCILGAAFAPRRIIRLLGAGLEHVEHGEAGHAAVTAGVAATAFGARRLYQMGRGHWTPSRSAGGTGSGGGGGSGGRVGGAANGQDHAGEARPTLPPRTDHGGGQSQTQSEPKSAPPNAAGATDASPGNGTGSGTATQSVSQLVDRHRAGDQQ